MVTPYFTDVTLVSEDTYLLKTKLMKKMKKMKKRKK